VLKLKLGMAVSSLENGRWSRSAAAVEEATKTVHAELCVPLGQHLLEVATERRAVVGRRADIRPELT
jgi:hypothetical protein